MSNFNITPGEIVKETYQLKVTEVVNAVPPKLEGKVNAPYVATIRMPLGDEYVQVYSDEKGRVHKTISEKGKRPISRVWNAFVVAAKTLYNELPAALNGKEGIIKFEGLTQDQKNEVDSAEKSFGVASAVYRTQLGRTASTEYKSRVLDVISVDSTGAKKVGSIDMLVE